MCTVTRDREPTLLEAARRVCDAQCALDTNHKTCDPPEWYAEVDAAMVELAKAIAREESRAAVPSDRRALEVLREWCYSVPYKRMTRAKVVAKIDALLAEPEPRMDLPADSLWVLHSKGVIYGVGATDVDIAKSAAGLDIPADEDGGAKLTRVWPIAEPDPPHPAVEMPKEKRTASEYLEWRNEQDAAFFAAVTGTTPDAGPPQPVAQEPKHIVFGARVISAPDAESIAPVYRGVDGCLVIWHGSTFLSLDTEEEWQKVLRAFTQPNVEVPPVDLSNVEPDPPTVHEVNGPDGVATVAAPDEDEIEAWDKAARRVHQTPDKYLLYVHEVDNALSIMRRQQARIAELDTALAASARAFERQAEDSAQFMRERNEARAEVSQADDVVATLTAKLMARCAEVEKLRRVRDALLKMCNVTVDEALDAAKEAPDE